MFSPSPTKIFLTQLFSWISIPIFLWVSPLPWLVVALFAYILYAGVGVALTFHRILSHGAFNVSPVIRTGLMTLATLANAGSPITWVAVHRAHHRYCDTQKDPHSPHHNSFVYVMFRTMYSKVSPKFAIDLMRDPVSQFLHKYYFAVQLVWIAFLYSTGGMIAVFALHFVPSGLTWLAGSAVNYFNHRFGYAAEGSRDSSTNNLITGFLVMGEGWHNNHHRFPTKASTSVNWWEFDLLYHVGKILGRER